MEQEYIIVGGIDSFSEQIVDAYFNTIEERGWKKNFVHITHLTEEEPLNKLKSQLYDIRENLIENGINSQPGLVLVASAFDSSGHENLKLLDQVSEILKVLFPGTQKLTLVVLLPPQASEDTAKIATYRFFLELEKDVYQVPFLSSVFVNQLSTSMYKQPDSMAFSPDETLFWLLDRQLLDPDLNESIKSMGVATISHQTTAAGRNTCYSTTGTYRLEYLQNECLRYLSKRLQKNIFENGLLRLHSEETDQELLQTIQAQCDNFTSNQIKKRESVLNDFFSTHSIKVTYPSGGTSPEEGMNGLLQQFYTAVDKIRSIIKNDLIDLNENLEKTLLEFLQESPEYFHGANFYLKALSGKQLLAGNSPEEIRLSGISQFLHDIYLAPVSSTTKAFIMDLLSKHGITLPVSQEKQYDNSWLTTAYKTLESKSIESNQDMVIYNFFIDCVDLFEQYTSGAHFHEENVLNFSKDLCGKFLAWSEKIDQKIQAIDSKRNELESIFNNDYQDIGFWKRNVSLRNEIKTKKNELESALEELNQTRQVIARMKDDLNNIIKDIFNAIILPSMLRSMYSQAFDTALKNMILKYESYIAGLRAAINSQWEAAEKYTKYKSSIVETVLNEKILTHLYSKVIGESSFNEHARDMLVWLPTNPSESQIKLPYYSCLNLAEHYKEKYSVLLKRMSDYSDDQVAWIKKLNIADILELLGEDEEKEYIKTCLTKLDLFLELSPGLIPLINNSQQIFSIRSEKVVNKDIISKFDLMMGKEPLSFDNGDPLSIDLMMVRFGFPAFGMHRLSECRELYLKQYGENGKEDLWPVLSDKNN